MITPTVNRRMSKKPSINKRIKAHRWARTDLTKPRKQYWILQGRK